jgi:hypothetical protein
MSVLAATDSQIASLYKATTTPQIIEVPELTFLMIDGQGDPNTSPDYQDAIQTLYGLSYALKFALRRPDGTTYGVSPLEGLWWATDPQAFEAADKSAWQWTAMIRQPAVVTADLLNSCAEAVARKRPLPAARAVRLSSFTEGRAAQVLHVGPYFAEGPTIARLHTFIAENGYRLGGKHHEIYLGDPRRAAPERLRTIIRQPFSQPPEAPDDRQC